MKQFPVRSLGGKIMYLAENTRPEIKFAIGKLSRYFHDPHLVHWKGLVVLAQYLRKHVNNLVNHKLVLQLWHNLQIGRRL